MQFRKGDRVVVIAADPERAHTIGRTGVVFSDGSLSGGLIAVKGLDGRISEAIKGYHGFYADQLRHA